MPSIRSLMRAYGITFSPWRRCFRVPLTTLQSLADSQAGKVQLKIAECAPGLRIEGAARAVGARLLFSLRVDLDGMGIEIDRRTLSARLSELRLTASEHSVGPLAQVVRRGGIDTTRPADLIGNQLGLPKAVVEARGERVVVDLLRLPALAQGKARKRLAIASALVSVSRIACVDGQLELKLALFPAGLGGFLKALLRHGLLPWLERVTQTRQGIRA